MMATSDENFSTDSGVAHSVHDVTRSGAAPVLRDRHTVGMHATATVRDAANRRPFRGIQGRLGTVCNGTRADMEQGSRFEVVR